MAQQPDKYNKTMAVPEKEYKLLEIICALNYGELHVYVTVQEPVRVEEIRKSIKL